jgi:uncharacterized membrane protein
MSEKSLGMNENVTALLAYVLGWVSGLIVFLLEEENEFVRFHAMQSMVVFGGITILGIVFSIVPILHGAVIPVLNLIGVVLWVILMIKAAQHERFRLPVISEITDDFLKKFKPSNSKPRSDNDES